jgi:hypothetical protein
MERQDHEPLEEMESRHLRGMGSRDPVRILTLERDTLSGREGRDGARMLRGA